MDSQIKELFLLWHRIHYKAKPENEWEECLLKAEAIKNVLLEK